MRGVRLGAVCRVRRGGEMRGRYVRGAQAAGLSTCVVSVSSAFVWGFRVCVFVRLGMPY